MKVELVHDGTKARRARPCLENARRIWSSDPKFEGLWFDRRSLRHFIGDREIEEHEVNAMRAYCTIQYRIVLSKDDAWAGMDLACRADTRDPLLEWFLGLRGSGHGWLDRLGPDVLRCPDHPMNAIYLRKFLLSAAWRLLRPGCKVDTVLVLKGEQGIGKSTWGEILFGPEHTMDDDLDITSSKDIGEKTAGMWGIELPEMSSLSNASIEAVKQFTSKRADRFRPVWARKAVTHPRCCVVFTTTNRPSFLRDSTGSRRFWVIEVGKVDLGLLHQIRNELWGEVMDEVLQSTGGEEGLFGVLNLSDADFLEWGRQLPAHHQWWLSATEEEERAELNLDYAYPDEIVSLCEEYLDENPHGQVSVKWLHEWINTRAFERHLRRASLVKLEQAMLSLGWTQRRIGPRHSRKRVFALPEK